MSKPSRRIDRPLPWIKKLCFAAATTAMFFGVLEVVLAVAGVRPVTESVDPYIGFTSKSPLLRRVRDSSGTLRLETAPAKLVWFNRQSFPATKPPGTRRVFCLGGSTTYGHPFSDSTSYSRTLRELLSIVDPASKWEVINAGGVSYASYRVATLMEELAQHEPDLFIVFSAHNEFLERRTYAGMFAQPRWTRELTAALQSTRTWAVIDRLVGSAAKNANRPAERLPAEVDEMLNHSVGPSQYHRDEEWQARVLRHYEWNLSRMVSIARQSGAEIAFIAPASNLRDCWPFKSEPAQGLSEASIAGQAGRLQRVGEQLEQQQFAEALESCRELLALDPRHAETHFHAGRALFGLGRFVEAERAFQRALDEDVCPLRATTAIVEAIGRVAREQGVTLIDFQQRLAAKSQAEHGHRCFGDDYFLDHVHPTIDVHVELGVWIIEALQEQGLVGGTLPGKEQVEDVRERIKDGIDTTAQAVAFRNLAKVLHWAGKFQEAVPHARQAIELMPGDLESRFVLADCLVNLGRREEAFEEYTRLFTIDEYLRAYLPMGELLAERGDMEEAKSYLLQALLTENREHRARAHYMLGLVHMELGEFTFAAESLQLSDQLYGNNPPTLVWLAEAQAASGDVDSAIESLRRVVELESDSYDAHYRLGLLYLSVRRLAEARRHLDLASRIDPEDARADSALRTLAALEADEK